MKSSDINDRSISRRQIGRTIEGRHQGSSSNRYKPAPLRSAPLLPEVTSPLQTQDVFTQETSSERPLLSQPLESHPVRDDSSSDEDKNICHTIASALCFLSSRKYHPSNDRLTPSVIQPVTIEENQPLLQGQPSLGEVVQLPDNTSQSSNSPAQASYHTPECSRAEPVITVTQAIDIPRPPQLSHQSTSWLSQPPASLLQEASYSTVLQPQQETISFEDLLNEHKKEMLDHRISIAERVQNNLESLYNMLGDPSIPLQNHKMILQEIVDLIVTPDQEKLHPDDTPQQSYRKKLDLSHVRTAAFGALVYALKHPDVSKTNKEHIVSFMVRFSENPDTSNEQDGLNATRKLGGISVNYQQTRDNSGMREETRTLHLSERIGIPMNPDLRLGKISEGLARDIRHSRTDYKNKLLSEYEGLIDIREDYSKQYEAELSECLKDFNRGSSDYIQKISERSDRYRQELKDLKAAYKKISSQDQGPFPRQVVSLLDEYNERLFRTAQKEAPQAASPHQPEEWNRVISSNPLNSMPSDQGVSYHQYNNSERYPYFHQDLEVFIKSFRDASGRSLFSGADGIENGYLKDYEAAKTIQSSEDCMRDDGTLYKTDRVQKEDHTGRRYSEDVIVEAIPARKPPLA